MEMDLKLFNIGPTGLLCSKRGSPKRTQGGHATAKTGNLDVNFSRQEEHREFSKFNFLHSENYGNTGKFLKI